MSDPLERLKRRVEAAAPALDPAAPVIDPQPPAPPPAPVEADQVKAKRGRPAGSVGKRKAKGPKDRHGRPFDPEIHLADADGRPILDTKGACRIKPRREALEERAAAAEADQVQEQQAGPAPAPASEADQVQGIPGAELAALAVSIYAGGLEAFTGRPVAEGSRAALQQAAARYLETSPVVVTPGAALALTAGAVTLGAIATAEAGTPAAALRDRFIPGQLVAMMGGTPTPPAKPDTAPAAAAPEPVAAPDAEKRPGSWF